MSGPIAPPAGRHYVRAGRVVTATERGVLEDGVVAVEGSRIAAVAAAAELAAELQRGPVEHHPDATLLPGLIDAHVHLDFEMSSNPARAGPRFGAQGALLPDGAVLIAGGLGQKLGDDPAVIFTPAAGQDTATTSLFQGTWVPTVVAPSARGFGAAAVLPDRAVLLSGGETDGGVTGAEIYVPCADAFGPCPF
jgi:hypothetical protein